MDKLTPQQVCTENTDPSEETKGGVFEAAEYKNTKDITEENTTKESKDTTADEEEEEEVKMHVDTGTQMDQYRALIPFDFAKELQLFGEKHVLALRQATEKNGQVSKDFPVKDVRTMIDKTKRNLIETNKTVERTIDTQKKVVQYDQSCTEKQIAFYKDKKA